MKIKDFLLLSSLVVVLTSCAPVTFYQVYPTESNGKVSKGTGKLYFENEHCKVPYHLRADQGDLGFLFQNRTYQTFEVDMEESYFLLNGIAKS